jgi:hypothetical protein
MKTESNTICYRLVKTKWKTEGGSTHSIKHLTPTLMSVLLMLQVATGGHVIIRRAWGECMVKYVLLKRRCSLEGKIWRLNQCNFITENQVEQVFTSWDSLLGEPMFKVEYDDTKNEMQKKKETKAERKTQRSTSGKLFNGAHSGVEALVGIQVFDILFYF